MEVEARPPELRRFARAVVIEWRELGWIGRVALLGVVHGARPQRPPP